MQGLYELDNKVIRSLNFRRSLRVVFTRWRRHSRVQNILWCLNCGRMTCFISSKSTNKLYQYCIPYVLSNHIQGWIIWLLGFFYASVSLYVSSRFCKVIPKTVVDSGFNGVDKFRDPVSGTWILDSNLKRDSRFLKLNLYGSRIPDCTGKNCPVRNKKAPRYSSASTSYGKSSSF